MLGYLWFFHKMGSRCSASFVSEALFHFSTLGTATARAMFGGHGVYLDGLHFSILAWNEIYLKVDAITEKLFVDGGCKRFLYIREGRLTHLNYYTAPDTIIENKEALIFWVKLALDAAVRARENFKRLNFRKYAR